MTVNELKIALEGEMQWARELLSGIEGIEYSAEVEGSEESSYTFGAVMLGTEGMSDEDRIYISLEVDINDDDTVDKEELDGQIESFRENLSEIAAALKDSEDKTATILEVGKRIDAELDAAYAAELERINRETSDRLWIAIGATAVILVVAAICIAMKLVLR
ncbi:MAG: hypothetical protein IJF05_04385 [Clostridia bacterium]|nr:hypothetical protein [Clostridia bacterium]